MNKPTFSSPYISFEIKDDILYVTYLPGGAIDLEIAKEIVKSRLEYTESKPYPILVIDNGVVSMNKEARDYSSDKDGGLKGALAGAVLSKSVYSEFLGNFFLRITKPEIPAKVFTDKAKALEWLEQFKPKV
ncbi:MAG TPA: hypothetical protein VK808_08010 [Bacteroidia bacterium]|nr:hypothetical protein [Bacteroidia bacterium]